MAGGVAQEPEDPFLRDLLQIAQQARRAAAPYFGEIPDPTPSTTGLSVRVIDSPDWNFLTLFVPTILPGKFDCKVFVNRAHATNVATTNRAMTLDIVHCYQSWRMGTDEGFDGTVPAWAWEGVAAYIMLEALPTQEDDFLYWATYLLLPDVSLFERSYDAMGVYAQAREAGVDLGPAFVSVLADVDNPERFALAGLASSAMLDKWASEHLRTRFGDWGPNWEFLGPGLYSYDIKTAVQPMTVTNGSEEAFSQDAYSNFLFSVNSAADIVKVEAFGRVRIGDGSVDAIGGGIYCTTAKGCGPCPDGSSPSVVPTPLASDWALAVSGGTDGANGFVSGHPLEEFCQKTPEACPDGPGTDAGTRPIALLGGSAPIAQADCTPEPTDDAFCGRYRAYVAWAQTAGDDITRAKSAEVERRFIDMQPYAPAELAQYVDLMIEIYGTFARAPDPVQVPITGQLPLELIPEALRSMHAYCGMPAPF
jgi:hypothetical protein